MFGLVRVKLSPKSNIGFICECIRVKPSCKSIITTKEALLRFTIILFPGKLIFNGVLGQHETLLIVSPGSLHINMSIENIVCVHSVY